LGIKAEDLNDEFFDAVFLGLENKSKVSSDKIKIMRDEFMYWYPMDLRCSGKDLIKNHLTMSLFNHQAIWEDPKMMPRGYFCNGYV
jgi:leucyl-tRNA synthetase